MTALAGRRLSLRSRLLAGLIAVTAAFIVVMGVVSTVVYQRLAEEQFNDNILLTANDLEQIVNPPSGYLSVDAPVAIRPLTGGLVRTGPVTLVTPSSPTGMALQDYLADLIEQRTLPPAGGQPFDLTLSNGQVLRAVIMRKAITTQREALKSAE